MKVFEQDGAEKTAASSPTDTDAIHDNTAGEIAAITEKASPVGADLIVIEDSAAANVKKRVQLTNLPSTEVNDLSAAVTWDNIPDANVAAAFTTGSVVFSDGSGINESNATFFWDDTNKRLCIGTTTGVDDLTVVGAVDIQHTATAADEHALEIDCDAAGFGDIKAVDINYDTGAIATGSQAF